MLTGMEEGRYVLVEDILFAAIDREYGGIDVLVNNAAALAPQPRLPDCCGRIHSHCICFCLITMG